jgi:hypothetical protein
MSYIARLCLKKRQKNNLQTKANQHKSTGSRKKIHIIISVNTKKALDIIEHPFSKTKQNITKQNKKPKKPSQQNRNRKKQKQKTFFWFLIKVTYKTNKQNPLKSEHFIPKIKYMVRTVILTTPIQPSTKRHS